MIIFVVCGSIKIGKIYFVDFVGLEKVEKIGVEGKFFCEVKIINKLFLVFGNVINVFIFGELL